MKWDIIIAVISAVFASSGLWAFILAVYNNKQRKHEGENLERQALLGLLHEKLIEKCDYYIDRGFITEGEMRDLDHYLYDPYKKLGGNGLVEALHQSLMDILKIREDTTNEN